MIKPRNKAISNSEPMRYEGGSKDKKHCADALNSSSDLNSPDLDREYFERESEA